MGRRCYICKKWDYRHPNLTFYSITKDIVLRRKWFDVMGVTDTDLPQLKEVCSEHFTNDDFETTLSGKKRLKKNVVPTLYTKEEDRKQLKVDHPLKVAHKCNTGASQEGSGNEPAAKRCHYPLKEAFLSATGASQEAICGEPAPKSDPSSRVYIRAM